MVSRSPLVVPARVVWSGDSPILEWREIERQALDRPFWDDAVRVGRIVRLNPLDELPRPSGGSAAVGGIFHSYRCGSTLLCRQFSAVQGCYAISEAEAFSQLVTQPGQSSVDLRERLLRLLGAFAAGLAPLAQRLVIKWPGLLAHHAGEMGGALPEMPNLYLHRDSVEVLASIEASPLGRMDTLERHYSDFSPLSAVEAQRDAIGASAALIAGGLHRAASMRGLVHCDYAWLPEAAVSAIAPFFRLDLTAQDHAAMQAAGEAHSKFTDRGRFAPDSAAKRAAASPRARWLAEHVVEPERARLQSLLPDIRTR